MFELLNRDSVHWSGVPIALRGVIYKTRRGNEHTILTMSKSGFVCHYVDGRIRSIHQDRYNGLIKERRLV